jgi:hypothetical protein
MQSTSVSVSVVRRTGGAASGLAVVLGILLLIEGIWGLFSPVVFGVLSTNVLHACIHIILGGLALWAGPARHARGFLGFLGVLLVLVAVLWFIPATRSFIVDTLSVNRAVAIVNLVVGVLCLLVRSAGPRTIIVEEPTTLRFF